jgi:dTDP-4-amino-4,6-dideoxy-D-galactose acyltransferase
MIRHSEFDSRMLGRKVGRATVGGLTPALVQQLRDEQAKQEMALVLIRDNCLNFSVLHMLPWETLRLSDVKILLSTTELPSESRHLEGFYLTRDLRSGDMGPLRAMVSQIAELSQYRRFFGREVALSLYEQWLENSLSGQVADHCFLVRSQDVHEPAGFVAVKIQDQVAETTLVAVGESYKGLGIGRFFLSNVLYEIGKLGAKSCTVATQITNRSALRLYNSLGFRFDSYRVDLILYQEDDAPDILPTA